MSETHPHSFDLAICGGYEWPIHSPTPNVVLKYQTADGNRSWDRDLSLNLLDDDEHAAHVLELELQERMYPTDCESRLWIETRGGDPIYGIRAVEPSFQFRVLTSMEHRDSIGHVTIWIGERSSLTHRIQLGWRKGMPVEFEIQASLWPPTFFLVGNNQIRTFPILTLEEKYLRALWERMDRCAEEFKDYEEAYYCITSSIRPAGILRP